MPQKHTFDGQLIRSLRQKMAFTQRELARLTDVDAATISRIENGVQPSARTLSKIASVLKVNPEELLRKAPSGTTLAHLREQKGMTQSMLAAQIKIPRAVLSDIETGQKRPSARMLQRILEALDVDREFVSTHPWEDKQGVVEDRPVPDMVTASDFAIQFAPEFSPTEVKSILTALANYYRACGGLGFELQLQLEEAFVKEPINA
jgi:transcriptional regulator with XRE-family HTH domain